MCKETVVILKENYKNCSYEVKQYSQDDLYHVISDTKSTTEALETSLLSKESAIVIKNFFIDVLMLNYRVIQIRIFEIYQQNFKREDPDPRFYTHYFAAKYMFAVLYKAVGMIRQHKKNIPSDVYNAV